MSSLRLGDHLITPRLGYTHHGIYVGNNDVIHYQGPSNGEPGEIVLSSLDAFCDGRSLHVRSHPDRAFSRAECVRRAYQRLGESDYNLLFNNCEHFVMWCIENSKSSSQVNHVATSVALGQATKIAASKTTAVLATGASLGSTLGATAATSIAAVSSAPVWVPVAVGIGSFYAVQKVWSWLTD